MKLKENFVLRQVADTWVVLPVGAATLDFNGMLTLNETGAFLWQALLSGKDPVEAILAEYDVSKELATADVEEFLTSLRTAGCLDD